MTIDEAIEHVEQYGHLKVHLIRPLSIILL